MKEKPNFDKSKKGKFVNNEKGGKGVVLNGKSKNGIKTNKKFKSNL